jgi:FtsP/CotA-like multicopper oxidase with cupredoxin domain
LQHPIHLHLVHFQVVRRNFIKYDVNAVINDEDQGFCPGVTLPGDGVCLAYKTAPDGSVGLKAYFSEPANLTSCHACGREMIVGEEFSFEKGGRTDIVTAMPGQVTTIRVKFDKLGEYTWHCHIISHEDHEMMRRFQVVA